MELPDQGIEDLPPPSWPFGEGSRLLLFHLAFDPDSCTSAAELALSIVCQLPMFYFFIPGFSFTF